MIPKSSNLVKEMILGYPTSGTVFRSKGQGHKVQKHTEGDQVAGASLHLRLVMSCCSTEGGQTPIKLVFLNLLNHVCLEYDGHHVQKKGTTLFRS